MKIYKLFLSCFILLGVASCTDDLISVSYSDINPSIFPQTEADVEAMVNTCYYPLRGGYGSGIHSTSETGIQYINDLTTEILHSRGSAGMQYDLSTLNYDPMSSYLTYFYDEYYNRISQMTLTIDRIQESGVSDELKEKAIAEVRCARGLLAYELYDMYGPIVVAPLEILKNPLTEVPLARLSQEEMVKFIEDDLVAAAENLPDPAEADYGRFSKALAKMIHIRLALHEKDWDKVIELADDIIGYEYFSLEDDYAGMWDLDGASKSQEVIWAIPCNYEGTSENQWQLMVLPPNYDPKGGWATVQSTWWFYDTFEANDSRKEMLITEYTGTDGVTYNRSNPGSNMNNGPIPLKINEDADRTTSLTTVDIIMYRYPDVLLSKAEALANSTGTPSQEAMDLVNEVRNRAHLDNNQLADYSSLDDFNDMILTERSHEFWCENGQYRADLIRHGKLVSRSIEITGSEFANEYKEVYPFSLDRISEGKGEFIQNPGYY